ncbi:MAG: polysaccharide biosynthesis/export family protein, partial [bacterium]
QENYSAAMVDFKQVIELEKGFHLIYTPYAQQYIQKALDKIKEKEEDKSTNNINTEEEIKIDQIISSYKDGKQKMVQENYSAAMVDFKQVIELEKGFHLIYTPYAQQNIQKALDKIKEKEERDLANSAAAEKKEDITADTSTSLSPKAPAPQETSYTSKTADYIIGVDDVLFISVWQNKDLDQEVTVRPDGKISALLIGDIQAEGSTIPQLDEQITTLLKEYIKFPEVSISLRKIGGKKIILLGEVNRPGVYAVSSNSTILELIALANGYTKDAVLDSVIVIRGGLQKPVGKRLDLARAIKKADMSQNIILEPEDIVYVPKNFISNVNYFVSQILGPITQGLSPAEIVHHW